jgi:cell volume regulation protein A
MFLTLGLQVFPSRLAAVATPGLTVACVLMFLARPAAVLLLLLGSRLSWRERILVSWVGLRGAAPIVLATFPLIAGISKAGLMFDIVFFIVLTSGLLQGSSIGWVAARLGLLDHSPQPAVDPLELMSNGERDVVRFSVGASSPANGRRIVDLALPPETLVLLVERGGIYMIPRGGTALQQGDQVLILAARDQLPAVERSLGPAVR